MRMTQTVSQFWQLHAIHQWGSHHSAWVLYLQNEGMDAHKQAQAEQWQNWVSMLPTQPHHITSIWYWSKHIYIGTDQVSLGTQAKNLGVILDSALSMETHITSTCKAANYHLYCLSRIRKYLTSEALKMAVHALISSKLDYCNSLLIGLPTTEISKLQNIVNSAARLISGARNLII